MNQTTPYQLDGFRIEALLSNGVSKVFRAVRAADEHPVVLKFLGDEYPRLEDLARFRHEFEISRKLRIPGVIEAYDLLKNKSSMVMVLEDFGGMALGLDRPMELNEFLVLAIAVAEAIAGIHRAGVIHKDINPSNIVRSGATVKIIDFGIASELSSEEFNLKGTGVLEGTLDYISPEQTGRMNRTLDYRTDLYSLGATLYHLLTGRAPFAASDPMELIHCHLARIPTAPRELRPDVPATLSDIILKLLAKTAEERYQSANVLIDDLERCRERLRADGPNFAPFPVAADDVSARFQIPEKLYGREAEVERLLSAFKRMSVSGPDDPLEVVTVSGYSGIGKSMLVHEIHRPITRRRGYFISGKFDQLQRNKPYASIIESFRELLGQILTESDARIDFWREHLRAALGPNGRVITDVLPELELIIGEQTPVPVLPPVEAQNRFNLVFQNFVKAFTPPEHPLVCFLDDLQWADRATLELLEYLLSGKEAIHLLLIIAYRDNEVDASHPTITTLEKIEASGTNISPIVLRPLSHEHVARLLGDTLRCSPSEATTLADLLVEKTEGNPFFLKQYLHRIHKDGLIRFDEATRSWRWDAAEIARMEIASNVVDLMVQKIDRLTEESRELLKRAACIGTRFDLATIAIVSKRPSHLIARALWPALEDRVILPADDNYKLIGEGTENIRVSYRFPHDRIQQAAYSLVAEAERAGYHLEIGRLLHASIPAGERERRIFDIVNQTNAGLRLLTDPDERAEYARLNLIAGRQARASAAFASAYDYFQTGIELIGQGGWDDHYDLTLDLHGEGAEAAYLSGRFEVMQVMVETTKDRAHDLLDRIRAYEVEIASHITQNRFREAVRIGLTALNLLGENIPVKPSRLQILFELIRTTWKLRRMSVADHLALPPMSDPFRRAAQRIYYRAGPAIYYSVPELLQFVIFKIIQLSIIHGHTKLTPFAYATYGMVLCGVLRDFKRGEDFSEIALALTERYDAREEEGRTCYLIPAIILHWRYNLREVAETWYYRTYRKALDGGDLEFAGSSIWAHACTGFYFGLEIDELIKRQDEAIAICRRLGNQAAERWTLTYRQACANLQGRAANPGKLIGEHFDVDQKRVEMLSDETGSVFLHIVVMQLGFHFDQIDDLDATTAACDQLTDGVLGSYHLAMYWFWDALCQLKRCATAGFRERWRRMKRVRKDRSILKHYARTTPMNYAHKMKLIDAELARLKGRVRRATRLYDESIRLARENEFLNEEALALELAGRFHGEQDQTDRATGYLKQARHAYLRWGAHAKVTDIETRYGIDPDQQ